MRKPRIKLFTSVILFCLTLALLVGCENPVPDFPSYDMQNTQSTTPSENPEATSSMEEEDPFRPRSETEILTDLEKKDEYFSEYGVKITSFNITKRQTNLDSKTDYIWIEATGSTSDIDYFSDYKLTYVLYNDGWLLEEYDRQNSWYTVKSLPDQELINTTLLENCPGECVIEDSLIENKWSENDTYYLYYSETDSITYPYLSIKYITTVEYNYFPYSGWTVGKVTRIENSNVPPQFTADASQLLGKWHAHGEGTIEGKNFAFDFYVTVYHIDDEGISLLLQITNYGETILSKSMDVSWTKHYGWHNFDGYTNVYCIEVGKIFSLEYGYYDFRFISVPKIVEESKFYFGSIQMTKIS